MPARTSDILLAAANILKTSGKVAAGHLAVDRKGNPCQPHSARATALDALGAIYHATGVRPDKTADHATLVAALAHLDFAASLLFQKSISRVNDEHGLDAVLDCYRAAWRTAAERTEDAGA